MDKETEKEIIEFDLKCQKLNLLKKNNMITKETYEDIRKKLIEELHK